MGIIIGEFYNNIYNHISENVNYKDLYNASLLESSNKERNIIIFDLGSVLIDGDFDKALLQDPRIPNECIEDLKNSWIIDNPKFTETCTKDEYIREVIKQTPDELKYLIPVVEDINSTYLNILPHTYSLLNTLRKNGYSLYYLSNWCKWHAEELIRNGKMDFLRLFDGGLFSYECGYMKPDERMYTIFLNKYSIDPNNAIFFDDKQDNIDTANKLGIQGILFTKETGNDILKDFILNESYIQESQEPDYIPNNQYEEQSLSSKERNSLDDDEFGIPELRKYPLNDKVHVQQAIRMFNHVEKKYEAELADNILDAMERYHISTDTVGDKNRLKKYIKESDISITEGLIWNDNTPSDINKLKEDIKEEIKINPDIKRIIDAFKDSLKNADFASEEKAAIFKLVKKVHVDICGYTVKTATYGSAEISNTHVIIGTFKNYILSIKFIGSHGVIAFNSITINYDSSKCDIPKNVAFDFISMLSPYVDKVRSTRRSIKISALSNSINSGYPRVSHKYSNKYSVKKGLGGLYITLSTLKIANESSPIAGAMHRQDYQPDAVYIINYLKKNTFETDIAICKDQMSSIFVYDEKPIIASLSDFNEMNDYIELYKFNGECNFNSIIESASCSLDFYRNMVNDKNVTIDSIKNDYRFTEVSAHANILNSIKECIINSIPKPNTVHEVYCPCIPLVDLNDDDSSVHYFRDINGVYAQNIDTLARSASYRSIGDIPKTTICILKNI